jgi:hypothetical protein
VVGIARHADHGGAATSQGTPAGFGTRCPATTTAYVPPRLHHAKANGCSPVPPTICGSCTATASRDDGQRPARNRQDQRSRQNRGLAPRLAFQDPRSGPSMRALRDSLAYACRFLALSLASEVHPQPGTSHLQSDIITVGRPISRVVQVAASGSTDPASVSLACASVLIADSGTARRVPRRRRSACYGCEATDSPDLPNPRRSAALVCVVTSMPVRAIAMLAARRGNVAVSRRIRSANAREGLHSEPGARGCGEAMDAARRRGQADVRPAPWLCRRVPGSPAGGPLARPEPGAQPGPVLVA